MEVGVGEVEMVRVVEGEMEVVVGKEKGEEAEVTGGVGEVEMARVVEGVVEGVMERVVGYRAPARTC